MALDPRRVAARAVAAVLVSVATYYAFWGGEYSAFDLGRLATRQQAETASLHAIRAEVDSLRLLAETLESDPVAIETVARERFGMIREGEILYRFVKLDAEGEAPAAP